MYKIFTLNKNGKIELTKDELQKMLDEAYWDGFRSKSFFGTSWTYKTPSINDYQFTANTISNSSSDLKNSLECTNNANDCK